MAALTLGQGAAITGDQTFQYRVAMAFYYVARGVLAEATTVYGHELRANFARSIVLQDYTRPLQYAALVATDPTIVAAGPATQTAITDQQIITAVTNMWNAIAAVPPAS